MPYYRLELCPTAEGLEYYKSYETTNRSNANAGVDLYSVEDYKLCREFDERHNTPPKAIHLLDLGTKARLVEVSSFDDGCTMESDAHYWLLPRSSIYKSGIMMANSVGVIDSSYRDMLMAPITNLNEHTYPNVSKGTRLFQIVAPNMGWIKEIKIVESLPETNRKGGFGSTGMN